MSGDVLQRSADLFKLFAHCGMETPAIRGECCSAFLHDTFLAKHTSQALILCLRMEFAVWAEGDEYNGEKIEERREGEWGWRRVRG